MGEYIKYRGEEIKLGTCESLYYARLEDLKKMVGLTSTVPGNAPIGAYLDPANGFRYRFPFPEEDNVQPGHYEPYNKGLTILLTPELAPQLVKYIKTDMEHDRLCTHLKGVNIFYPCPLSANPPTMSNNGPTLALDLTQVKQVDGEVWVVCDCHYCGSKFRLEKTSAAELAACARARAGWEKTEKNAEYWNTVADRIMQGYK